MAIKITIGPSEARLDCPDPTQDHRAGEVDFRTGEGEQFPGTVSTTGVRSLWSWLENVKMLIGELGG